MDVPTITMPADEARELYDRYRAALAGKEPTDEDRGILLGYQALAKGRAVLNLTDVLRNTPVDAQGNPRLAVARGQWRWCHLRRRWNGGARFGDSADVASGRGRPAWHRWIGFREGTLPEAARPTRQEVWREAKALVPLIPPNLRPKNDLHRYVILFEAEWQPVPPTDPLLLRHLHGDLYAVLAAWDLTPLERAVLAGRFAEARA